MNAHILRCKILQVRLFDRLDFDKLLCLLRKKWEGIH